MFLHQFTCHSQGRERGWLLINYKLQRLCLYKFLLNMVMLIINTPSIENLNILMIGQFQVTYQVSFIASYFLILFVYQMTYWLLMLLISVTRWYWKVSTAVVLKKEKHTFISSIWKVLSVWQYEGSIHSRQAAQIFSLRSLSEKL